MAYKYIKRRRFEEGLKLGERCVLRRSEEGSSFSLSISLVSAQPWS